MVGSQVIGAGEVANTGGVVLSAHVELHVRCRAGVVSERQVGLELTAVAPRGGPVEAWSGVDGRVVSRRLLRQTTT